MSQPSWLPLKHLDDLQAELREEISQLEFQLEHFDDLPQERRFASRSVYQGLIRVRRELLSLLQADIRLSPDRLMLSSRSSENA